MDVDEWREGGTRLRCQCLSKPVLYIQDLGEQMERSGFCDVDGWGRDQICSMALSHWLWCLGDWPEPGGRERVGFTSSAGKVASHGGSNKSRPSTRMVARMPSRLLFGQWK